jgi:DNA (cytosine-5)-methyltransferase 1
LWAARRSTAAGPTRARLAWRTLHVNGLKLSDAPPVPSFVGLPYLTVPMLALLQGFPADWQFIGKKAHAYRQVGNAFPPPVAAAVARRIALALKHQQHPRLAFEDVA